MRRRFWRAVARFAVRMADRGGGYDWTEDDSLRREDIRARLELLEPVEVVGRPRVVLTEPSATWSINTMPQTWTTNSTTYGP